jgi:hypothetical protein
MGKINTSTIKLIIFLPFSIPISGAKCITKEHPLPPQGKSVPIQQVEEETPSPNTPKNIGCLIEIDGTQLIVSKKEVRDKKLESHVIECLEMDTL